MYASDPICKFTHICYYLLLHSYVFIEINVVNSLAACQTMRGYMSHCTYVNKIAKILLQSTAKNTKSLPTVTYSQPVG